MVSNRPIVYPPAIPFPWRVFHNTLTLFALLRYLIWIGSDQEKTFGPTISNLIHRHLGKERCCLWDSKARGAHRRVERMSACQLITSLQAAVQM